MEHGILRHQVCGEKVGHPGIVLVCPDNRGTRDVQINCQLHVPRMSNWLPQIFSLSTLMSYLLPYKCNEKNVGT